MESLEFGGKFLGTKHSPYGRFGPSHDRDLARSQINLYYFVLIELTRVLQTLVLRDF